MRLMQKEAVWSTLLSLRFLVNTALPGSRSCQKHCWHINLLIDRKRWWIIKDLIIWRLCNYINIIIEMLYIYIYSIRLTWYYQVDGASIQNRIYRLKHFTLIVTGQFSCDMKRYFSRSSEDHHISNQIVFFFFWCDSDRNINWPTYFCLFWCALTLKRG